MGSIKNWFKSLTSSDPRKNSRRKTPPLVAYFWDGGAPVAHSVQDISPTGFFLATEERWLIGTLIMMTLQRTSSDSNQPDCSVIVMSKVVRYGEGGVGFAFIPVEPSMPGQQPGPGSHAADKRTLEKFLHLLQSDEGSALPGSIFLLLLALLATARGTRELVFAAAVVLMALALQTRSGVAALEHVPVVNRLLGSSRRRDHESPAR